MNGERAAGIATIHNLQKREQEQTMLRTRTIIVLAALALALTFVGSASAANFVDVTYDVADTIILNPLPDCPLTQSSYCVTQDLLDGNMKIRYTSNSASSMPIVHGPATLQSLTLKANVFITLYGGGLYSFLSLTQGTFNIGLASSAVGNLLSGGTLTFPTVQLVVTGSRHCPGFQTPGYSGFCIAFFGTLTSIVGPLGPFTTTGALSFAASPGPYGGAQSTRHTVSGTITARVPSKVAEVAAGGTLYSFATGANLVGREVLREAEGHDPKVTPIPEPGTLLLLGTGTAGLALVGRATRRSRH